MIRRLPRGALRWAVPVVSAWLASCGREPTRDVRATILDESGAPVTGAVFYAEIYDESGPVTFLSAVAGSAGEVPDSAREAIYMPSRRGARIALAAFAPGYRPTVHRRPDGRVESDGAVLTLERVGDGPAWTPAVADLGFPFPDDPELAARAADPRHDPLRKALRAAWAARRAMPEPLTTAEERKVSALEAGN